MGGEAARHRHPARERDAALSGYGQAGGNREFVARRTFRHPDGHEATLLVETVDGSGRERWFRISLDGAPRRPELAKLMGIAWHKTRASARRDFAERQRALREAGFVREG